MSPPVSTVLVLGRPCAGKSTVARWIATAHGRDHVSVGDLIRDAYRTDEEFRVRNAAAFQGREGFAPEVIARLLGARLAACGSPGRGQAVIDGGPPMEHVVELLGLRPVVTLVLCAGPSHTEERFGNRAASAAARDDDEMALFRQRSLRYERFLPATVRRLADQGPVHLIDATGGLPGVLRQVASALLLPHPPHPVRPVGPPGERGWPGTVTRLWSRSRAGGEAVRSAPDAPRGPEPAAGNEPVLLLKPGFTTEPALVGQIEERAAAHGYRITQAAVWPGRAVREAGTVRAHLDLQYLIARWGRDLGAPAGPGAARVMPAYLYASRYGQPTLDAVWQEDGPVPPRRIAEGCWAHTVGVGRDRVTVLNGHVPRHVERYEAPGARVTALLLAPAGPGASPWRTLREVFLGATDPAVAHPRSLRAAARNGELALHGRVDFRNNAFHLSRGPLEAIRERALWFGGTPRQDPGRAARADFPAGLALVDAPLGPAGPWAYAATAETDAADPLVHRTLERLSARVAAP